MSIDRAQHNKDRPFTAIDNKTVNGGLSMQSLGLLTVMLSNADNWKFNRTNLMKRTGLSQKGLSKSIDELKSSGYLVITKRNSNGNFAYDWQVHEVARDSQLNSLERLNKNDVDLSLPLSIQADIKSFSSSSDELGFLNGSEMPNIYKVATKLYKQLESEVNTSRLIKVAILKSYRKQPNPFGYLVTLVNSWIDKGVEEVADVDTIQLDSNGTSLITSLGIQDDIPPDEIALFEEALDENSIDW